MDVRKEHDRLVNYDEEQTRREKLYGTREQRLWISYLSTCTDRQYDYAMKMRAIHGDSYIYTLTGR